MKIRKERTLLLQEAIQISKDLVGVTFLGGVAMLLHTNSARPTYDLDLAVISSMTDRQLEKNGYHKYNRGDRRTPRGYKVDIFRDKPVNDIPISTIISTAIPINVRKYILKVVSLEILIIMKYVTNRPQDNEDLLVIAKEKYQTINWQNLKLIVKDQKKYLDIYQDLKFLNKQEF